MKKIYGLLFLLFSSLPLMAYTFDENIIVIDFKIEEGIMRWTTSKEINNKAFIIESSEDGEHWKMLDHLEGKEYSDIEREYRYKINVPSTTTYFRLKSEDMEGNTATYSKVLEYEVLKEKPYITYEVGKEHVKFKTNDKNVKVMILNDGGHEEYQGYIKDGDAIKVEKGIHFIKLTSPHQHVFRQLVIK